MKKFLSIITSTLILCSSFMSVFAYQADKNISFYAGTANGIFGGGSINDVYKISIQSDGKILAGGRFTLYDGLSANHMVRLNSDGSRDTGFNIGVGFDGDVYSIVIQDNEKILVGGSFYTYNGSSANGIIRLNSDGSIDTGFNIGDGFDSDVYSIVIQDDGKILVGGYFNTYNGTTVNYIARLNYDGSLDTSFDIGGGFDDASYSLALQPDGKIIVGGYFYSYSGVDANSIIRLNSDGSIDTGFNIGVGFDDYVEKVVVQNDGKILVGGRFSSYDSVSANYIIRLNSDGSIDTGFDMGGGFDNWVTSIVPEDDGKIIVGGYFNNYQSISAKGIIRLNSDGSRDTGFDMGNGFNARVYAITLNSTGSIFVGGRFISYNGDLARGIISLNSDGSRDTSFSDSTAFNNIEESTYMMDTAFQDDGKIIVAGGFHRYNKTVTNHIARLNSDGSKDISFNAGGSGFNSFAKSLAIQDDGKIVVGGYFNNYNGTTVNKLIRLNSDGSIDSSFNIGGGFNSNIMKVIIQSDGKVLVGGWFSTCQGVTSKYMARLNSDGSRDTSLNLGTSFNTNGFIYSLALQNDGKIVAGGNFTSYQGVTTNRIIRLNSDGSRDTGFNMGAGFNSTIMDIKIQDDGKILVAGNFSSYSGSSVRGLVRLNSDGSIDNTFLVGNLLNGYAQTIAIQDDGKIIAGGTFTSYDGVPANYIIRLNSDGSRDTSFDVGGGFDNNISLVRIDNDGRIFVGGGFYFYKGISSPILTVLNGDSPVILPNTTNLTTIDSEFTNKGYTLSGSILSGSTRISLSQINGLIPSPLNLLNGNNLLHLPKNLQFKQSDGTTNYTSEILPPINYSVATIDNKTVVNAISVGSTTESIKLANEFATLSIPALGKTIGDPLSIYSSQDGTNWTLEKGAIVQNIDGQPYAVFTTNHFTYFAIAGSTGAFVINDDNGFTTGQTVTLSISAPTAQNMRFSNDGSNRSAWESYATSKSWNLSAGNGTKTVYAEFDTDGDYIADASSSDSIQFVLLIQGQLTLEILTGTSECMYATSLYLGAQDVKLDQAYTFTGSFSGQWYCADYVGVSSGWSLTIQVSDLTSAGGNVISGSNLLVSHGGATTQGDSACTGYDGAASAFYGSPYVLIEKASGSDKICKVTLNNVDIEVTVPAFQAPGDYVGTLTLTVPSF